MDGRIGGKNAYQLDRGGGTGGAGGAQAPPRIEYL